MVLAQARPAGPAAAAGLATAYGLATAVLPLFIVHPSMGYGCCGRRSGWRLVGSSYVVHDANYESVPLAPFERGSIDERLAGIYLFRAEPAEPMDAEL